MQPADNNRTRILRLGTAWLGSLRHRRGDYEDAAAFIVLTGQADNLVKRSG